MSSAAGPKKTKTDNELSISLIPVMEEVQPNPEKLKFLNELSLGVHKRVEENPPTTESVEQFLHVLQQMLPKKDFRKVKSKVCEKCSKLTTSPRHTMEVSQKIARSVNEYTTKLTANPKEKWACTLELLEFLDDSDKYLPGQSLESESAVPSTSAQARARASASKTKKGSLTPEAKKKRVEKLERKLYRVGKVIKEIDEAPEADDNWGDDWNSPYLVKTRLVDKYMAIWKELCKVDGAIRGTGRPVQKVVRVQRVSKYPEIDKEAEKYLSSKGIIFFPDYHDILKLVKDANQKHQLFIAEDDFADIAKDLFQQIVKILKRRRARDLDMGLEFGFEDEEEMPVDPADHDPELARKLEENVKLRKTEAEILRKFSQNQEEMKAEACDVIDNDPDASAPEDDDESESEALEVEVAEEEDSVVSTLPKTKRRTEPEVVHIDLDDIEQEANSSDEPEVSEEPPPPVKRLRSCTVKKDRKQ